MKMTPIIISTPLIPPTLSGDKTVTRRIIKPQPKIYKKTVAGHSFNYGFIPPVGKCPYGQPGDRLWGREKLQSDDGGGTIRPSCISYSADGKRLLHNNRYVAWQWKKAVLPSIFMPRWASRIDLDILSISGERVQEISEEDCIKEGIKGNRPPKTDYYHKYSDLRFVFAELWDSLHAKPKLAKKNPYTWEREDCYVSYPWEDIREERKRRGLIWYVVGNPWVWPIGFRRIK